MKDLKETVAEKLAYLRKENKMTQAELAEKLNYSDKSVSKWERGEALPDLEVLVHVAELFHVSLDYLVSVGDVKVAVLTKSQKHNRLIISLLGVLTVWVIATLTFVFCQMIEHISIWMLFVWAVPVSCIVAIVFNGLWGKRWCTFLLCSALVCSVLVCCYVQFLDYNLWQLFLIAVPAEVIIVLWSRLKRTPKKKIPAKREKGEKNGG